MNKGFIFNSDSKRNYLYFLSFIPLIIYGLYKNAYLLISNNYETSCAAYKIVLFPIMCGLIGYLIGLIKKKRALELSITGFLIGLGSPFNINMYVFILCATILLLISSFIPNKYKINEVALFIVILLLVNHFNNNIIIFNPMELSNSYKFTLLDLFFGRGTAFLFTSSIFWLLISYIILTGVGTYKKRIFVLSIVTFSILSLIYLFVTKDYLNSIKLFLNGNTFFAFIYLAPVNESSPSISYETLIYSVLCGLIAFIFVYLFKAHSGAIISVLIVSILYRIYSTIRQKILFKNN